MTRQTKALLFAIFTTSLIVLAAIAFSQTARVPGSGLIHSLLQYFFLPLLAIKVFKIWSTLGCASFLGAIVLTWSAVDRIFKEYLTRRHGELVAQGDSRFQKEDFQGALKVYLEATRLNEKQMQDGDLRLKDLDRLADLYKRTNDEASYLDAITRIKAIQAERERSCTASDEPWQKALRPKFWPSTTTLLKVLSIYLAILIIANCFFLRVGYISVLVITVPALLGSLLALLLNIACRIDFLAARLSAMMNSILSSKEGIQNN